MVLKMLDYYLKDRLQYIKIGRFESEKNSVKCGVPQGSYLGPLLLIICLNDVPTQKSKDSKSTQLFLIKIYKFTDLKKQLTINQTKTKHMVFGKGLNQNRHQKKNNWSSRYWTNQLFRYLGLILDKQLKFKDHINYFKENSVPFLPITLYENTASKSL